MPAIHDAHYDWEYRVYRKVKEVLPTNPPDPLVKNAIAINCHDTNLHHSMIADKPVARVLHLVNKNR